MCKMTLSEFLKSHQLTEAQLKQINLLVRPCRCGRASCSGWQFEDIHKTDLAITEFMTTEGL